jgi:hypothetical protein
MALWGSYLDYSNSFVIKVLWCNLHFKPNITFASRAKHLQLGKISRLLNHEGQLDLLTWQFKGVLKLHYINLHFNPSLTFASRAKHATTGLKQ